MVYITLTTIPTRLEADYPEGLKSCIQSLLEQDYPEYEIHFNIPKTFEKTGQEYVIPEWLQESEKLKIFRPKDRGTITKSLPTIERITDPEAIIIVVDDDLVYDSRMITEQIKNIEKYPECSVGYDGLRSRDEKGNHRVFYKNSRDHYYTANRGDCRVDILQHYKSVVYKRRFFEDDFFDFVNEFYTWHDDLTIAAYFSKKNRDRIVTYHPELEDFETMEEWLEKGGVTTFPVLRHTNHEGAEGCNVLRVEGVDDNSTVLYSIIDSGYDHLKEL